MPCGDLVGQLEQLRVLRPSSAARRGDLVGEQLAARRRPQPLDLVEGALVGDRELRISSTSSPQNSTRSGCSSVGGKTSTMPPRTANSPRFSTRWGAGPRPDHVLERAAGPTDAQLDRLEVAEALDLRLEHRAHRRDHDLDSGPWSASGPGWRSRRSTARRRPTVSLRGDSRSWGSVSQLGKNATSSLGEQAAEGGLEVLRLAARRGDHEDRADVPRGTGDGRDEEGAGAVARRDVDGSRLRPASTRDAKDVGRPATRASKTAVRLMGGAAPWARLKYPRRPTWGPLQTNHRRGRLLPSSPPRARALGLLLVGRCAQHSPANRSFGQSSPPLEHL